MYGYRRIDEVTGYAYEADMHCVECTKKRFILARESKNGNWLEFNGQLDSEGNTPSPAFLGDETDSEQYCGDCFEPIDTTVIGE